MDPQLCTSPWGDAAATHCAVELTRPWAMLFLQGSLGLVLKHLSAQHPGYLCPPGLFSPKKTSDTAVAGDLPSKPGRRKLVCYTKKKATDFLKCLDENCLSVLRLHPPHQPPLCMSSAVAVKAQAAPGRSVTAARARRRCRSGDALLGSSELFVQGGARTGRR